jgi:hypothetical protein
VSIDVCWPSDRHVEVTHGGYLAFQGLRLAKTAFRDQEDRTMNRPCTLIAGLSVSLFACAASPESTSVSSTATLETSNLTPDAFAKAVAGENDWIPSSNCTLTVERSGSDVVVTLSSEADSASLRVSHDAVITKNESDDHRAKWYEVEGIGTIDVIYALDNYNEIDLTPATTKRKITCGMYWG